MGSPCTVGPSLAAKTDVLVCGSFLIRTCALISYWEMIHVPHDRIASSCTWRQYLAAAKPVPQLSINSRHIFRAMLPDVVVNNNASIKHAGYPVLRCTPFSIYYYLLHILQHLNVGHFDPSESYG